MQKRKPAFTYNGLTIVLANPSRFDWKSGTLLSANGGRLVNDLLAPEYNLSMCEVRLKEDYSPLLDGTKVILLAGESAAKLWLQNPDNTIGEIRGSLFNLKGIHTIPTFFPQDAKDFKNYEKEFNPQDHFEDEEQTEDEQGDPKRRHGKTHRRNYAFWIEQDIKKCKYLLKHKQPPARAFEPNYIINPSSQTLIEKLNSATNTTKLFIDLETWYPNVDVKCCGFSFDMEPDTFVFPFFDHHLQHSYSNLPHIVRALCLAIARSTVIAHNGQCFDFPVLGFKYKIPTKKSEDTMIMMHRCFSDVEKSLGHLISLWTWEKFHKDMGNTGYNNGEQVRQTLEYCGIDVYTMKLCYYEMLKYANTIPGLLQSFKRANAAIEPYVCMTLQGIAFDEEERKKIIIENDKLMMQYIRMVTILVGEDNMKTLRGKGKSTLLASPSQQVNYFHELLGYPIVGKGKEKKDGTRGPSLGAKNMFKLRLKVKNPVIDLILAYRELAKESGSLKFIPWDINNITMKLEKPIQ